MKQKRFSVIFQYEKYPYAPILVPAGFNPLPRGEQKAAVFFYKNILSESFAP